MFWRKEKQTLLYLDEPKKQIFSQTTRFVGWFAGKYPLSQLSVFGIKVESLNLFKRKDVSDSYPGYRYCTGFSFELPTANLPGVSEIEITVVYGDNKIAKSKFGLSKNQSWEIKKEKLKALPSILDLGRPHKSTVTCYDFIDQSAIAQAGIVESTAISSHNYTEEMIDLINRVPSEGWILDCGSGYRNTEFTNVILLEIEPYVSTDVRAINESLPFKDNSFDLILSIVVLEHVQDPKLAVSEMIRVLKPNGKIWIDAAFMQPFHGYPNHFFNMTRSGLRSLFPKNIKVEKEYVPAYGTPIWSLTWILQTYVQGLPEEIRASFQNLTIQELLKNPEEYIDKDWVKKLSPKATETLAATNTIVVKKTE